MPDLKQQHSACLEQIHSQIVSLFSFCETVKTFSFHSIKRGNGCTWMYNILARVIAPQFNVIAFNARWFRRYWNF